MKRLFTKFAAGILLKNATELGRERTADLTYLANIRLPTEKAHGLQIMKMSEALAAQPGYVVTLASARRFNRLSGDPFMYYGIPTSFNWRRIPCIDATRLGKWGFLTQQASFVACSFVYLLFSRPEIVYTRDAAIVIAARSAGIRMIVWEQHTANWSPIIRRAARHASLMIMITHGLADFYIEQGVDGSRMLVEPDAADPAKLAGASKSVLREKLGLPQDRVIICYVGKLKTMGRKKGVEEIVEAVGAVRTRDPSVFLLVVGLNGDELDEAEALARQSGLGAGDYRFVTHVPHPSVADYLRAADVLVMNYPNEPHYARFMSPLKAFEYMASGVAMVTSDLPSLREVLSEREALFIEPDALPALVRGIETLVADPALRDRLGAAARERAAEFTWSRRAERIAKQIAFSPDIR